MSSDSSPESRKAPRFPAWSSLCVAAAYVALIAVVTRYRSVFEFDPDESNNLIKALLTDRGFALGQDIWTDQPPFFTAVLRAWLTITGWSVASARTLVLVFSGLLVFALQDTLRLLGSWLHGWVAVTLLVVSAAYVPLSVSVMIGLPAIALLALSLWALTHAFQLRAANVSTPAAYLEAKTTDGWRAPGQEHAWHAAAGALLGLSLTTKLFTAFMAPALVLLVQARIFTNWRRPSRRAFALASTFSGALALALVVGAWPLLTRGTWSGLIETHSSMRASRGEDFDGIGTVSNFLEQDVGLYALAALGVVWAVIRKRHLVHLWTCWLVLGLISLADHYPVWPHHRLLLSAPAAALAGFGVAESLLALRALVTRGLARRGPNREHSAGRALSLGLTAVVFSVATLPAIGVLVAVPERGEQILRPPQWSSESRDWAIHKVFLRYAERARLVAASRPIHAFRAGRAMPPDLAVTSWKRFRSGQLSAAAVSAEVIEFAPEVLLMSHRWPGSTRKLVLKSVKKTHCQIQRWPHQSTELWVKKSLLTPDELTRCSK